MKPTIGRIVHYKRPDTDPWPAIITKVHTEITVDITAWPPNSLNPWCETAIALSPDGGPADDHWWWPPRE